VNAEGDIPALRKKAKKGKINGPDMNRVNKLSQIALCWRDRKFLKRNLSRRVSVWHLFLSHYYQVCAPTAAFIASHKGRFYERRK